MQLVQKSLSKFNEIYNSINGNTSRNIFKQNWRLAAKNCYLKLLKSHLFLAGLVLSARIGLTVSFPLLVVIFRTNPVLVPRALHSKKLIRIVEYIYICMLLDNTNFLFYKTAGVYSMTNTVWKGGRAAGEKIEIKI